MRTTQFQTDLKKMQSNLLSFAYILTSNREHAHELTRQTTAKALDSEHAYASSINLKGWVFAIMRNIFAKEFRAQRQVFVCNTDIAEINVSVERMEAPENTLSATELTAHIDSLPEEYRQPIALHLIGYSVSEIARELGMTRGAARDHLFIGRQALRKSITRAS